MSDTGAAITRRDLVLGAGSLAAIGLLGLAGCEGTDPKGGTDAKESTDLRGKRLYFKSTYRYASNGLKDGDLCTFTFDDDDDSWHYAGPNEYGGTWTMEGENVILALATGPAMTLERLEDGDGYSLLGYEDVGVRYYLSEDDAQAWHDEFVGEAPERVAGYLESVTWGIPLGGSTATTKPTIAFSDGSITFPKGVWVHTYGAPSADSWTSADHSGEYAVSIDTILVPSGYADTTAPLYQGTITVSGESTDFDLWVEKDTFQLLLADDIPAGSYITVGDASFSAERQG